ncbi:putative n6-adenine methyltransferase domain-containing protein [Ditylenchus destructor]|uniref:N6-adenine methyltransferase domain-containing protein n=1 Tax=Ditylenchus destructor TaxID=166010 RepID=A0AAD4N9X1_9BILA|nr:putative n6-adenine methyltransferase domain-containing protein [Ditylenchus destructor]
MAKSKAAKKKLKGNQKSKLRTTPTSKCLKGALANVSSISLRPRQGIRVLVPETFPEVPQCSHGPCLLFADTKGNRWFSCAIYRTNTECGFKVPILAGHALPDYEKLPPEFSLSLDKYGKIKSSFEVLKGGPVYWCKRCFNYVKIPHMDPVESYAEWVPPTKLLQPSQANKGEAQYWFSSQSLHVLRDVITKEGFDSVLCVGAPTVFEKLRENQNVQSFLLDYDDRFAHFYDSSEFARYSMLVNHFYNAESRMILSRFLAKSKKCVIICDPPFGAFVEALIKSIYSLRELFFNSSSCSNPNSFKIILVLPIFVGKYVLKDESFSMVDFKVTYENHKDYSKPEKSIVRFFTDIANSSFILPPELGYRFCSKCDRFVAIENRHCSVCKKCTSKDGSKYVHCKPCGRCVKSKYVHCVKCKICHLQHRCLCIHT